MSLFFFYQKIINYKTEKVLYITFTYCVAPGKKKRNQDYYYQTQVQL